ncbi:MAG: hypothetical protein KG075_07485 [Alphaproteobacteria bacterium]|nr:hypothetical protein [Alphaproteobacteria bacterium]
MLIASWFNGAAIASLLGFLVVAFTAGRNAVEGSVWDHALSWSLIGMVACAIAAQPFVAWSLPSLQLADWLLVALAFCAVMVFGSGVYLLLTGLAELKIDLFLWVDTALPDRFIKPSGIIFCVCWLVELIILLVVA